MDPESPKPFSAPEYLQLLAMANRLERNPADAEDLVQDACMRLLLSQSGEVTARMPWMRTVMKNLVTDRLRRDCLHEAFLSLGLGENDRDPVQTVQSLVLSRVECARVLRIMASSLSTQELAALLLREVFEWRYRELAQCLGKTEPATRQIVNRAWHRLRKSERWKWPGERWRDDESDNRVYLLCLHALFERRPESLSALLRTATVVATTSQIPGQCEGTRGGVRSSVIHQVDGRFMMSLVLDGVVLCVIPLGVIEELLESAGVD